MSAFRVESGDMNESVDAESVEAAVLEALNRRNWTALGLLILIEGDTQYFLDAESALKKAGFVQRV